MRVCVGRCCHSRCAQAFTGAQSRLARLPGKEGVGVSSVQEEEGLMVCVGRCCHSRCAQVLKRAQSSLARLPAREGVGMTHHITRKGCLVTVGERGVQEDALAGDVLALSSGTAFQGACLEQATVPHPHALLSSLQSMNSAVRQQHEVHVLPSASIAKMRCCCRSNPVVIKVSFCNAFCID